MFVLCWLSLSCVFFCKQKTAYEMRISDWSSDVCSSDLIPVALGLLLNVVMHRGKLVETLMTEATVVGARIDQRRINGRHRRRHVDFLRVRRDRWAIGLGFRCSQPFAPDPLRLFYAWPHAATDEPWHCREGRANNYTKI